MAQGSNSKSGSRNDAGASRRTRSSAGSKTSSSSRAGGSRSASSRTRSASTGSNKASSQRRNGSGAGSARKQQGRSASQASRAGTKNGSQRRSSQQRARSSSRNNARYSKKQATVSAYSLGGGSSVGDKVRDLASALLENKIVTAVIAVILVLLLAGAVDAIANNGKAYGNVSINGMDVGGMNREQMKSALEQSFGERVKSTEVTLNAEEPSSSDSSSKEISGDPNRDLLAESVEPEYSEKTTTWMATADSLQAGFDYDAAIDEAMAAGRTAGPFGRLGLMLSKADVAMDVRFDEKSFEQLASNIDKSIGDTRVDATAIIEDGEARVLPGRDGKMVDRSWLDQQLKQAFMSEQNSVSLVVSAVPAASRTSTEQAQAVCDAINRALDANVTFTYQQHNWSPDHNDLASWTKVNVVTENGNSTLQIVIDPSIASQDLVKGLNATVSSDDVVVTFEVNGDDVRVHTNGSGMIPEIDSAIKDLEDKLYGQNGYGWNTKASPDIQITVGQTDAPESLTFDEALSLGLITIIGEYTTEFSDYEGTENRNHNIKLCADLLNNTVAKANGGVWSFNDNTGDTNQDPPFASAGSIVNGEYVDSVGGGVCQVATTVFNAVYEAGLEVNMRFNHTLYIASYPDGRDASVNYPDRDFIWTNTLPSDVLVKTSHTDTSVTAQLYSVYTGYRVETEEGTWEDGAKFRTSFETDENLASGQSYQKKYGKDGKKFSVTRYVYDKDGALIATNVFNSDYTPEDEVFVVGPGTDTSKLGSNAVAQTATSTSGDASLSYGAASSL